MTGNGDPRENAVAERVNGILKTERMWKNYYRSRNVPPDSNTKEDRDSVPKHDGMKNNCPEKDEQKALHQGNGSEA